MEESRVGWFGTEALDGIKGLHHGVGLAASANEDLWVKQSRSLISHLDFG